MKIFLMMILLTTSISSSFAQVSVPLKEGEVAPFSGHLIKKDRVVELIKAEKKVLTLKDLRIAQEELTEYYRQDVRVQRRKLSEAKFSGFLANTGYFILGVLITGFAFKVNQKIGDI